MSISEASLEQIESQSTTEHRFIKTGVHWLQRFLRCGEENGDTPAADAPPIEPPPPGDTPPPDPEPPVLLLDHPGESVSMNSEISSAMRAGNIEFLEKLKSYGTPMACFKNNNGDTLLHLAASFRRDKLVKHILSECPSLFLEPNWNDQIPLHTAAQAGHLDVVKTLMSFSERNMLDPYSLKNKDGNTPVHLALKNLCYRPEVMTHLVKTLVAANQDVSFIANEDKVSPLFLAVEAGNSLLVKSMLNCPGFEGNALATRLEGKRSLVHSALKTKNTNVLDVVLDNFPSLVNERDEEGRTCLSVAASVGFCEGICKLLDTSTLSIFDSDDDGSFPIHLAAEKGHIDVIKELLKRFPDSIHQLNKKGQNMFHILARYGKTGMDAQSLMLEEQDEDGNTPLHLATINWRPRVLLMFKRGISQKALHTKNNDGLRPIDIAKMNLQSDYVVKERMTYMVLLSLYKHTRISIMPTSGWILESGSVDSGIGKSRQFLKVLLVVATIVTTATFAAPFAMPGGFSSSGVPASINNPFLVPFILIDTLAMLMSVVAIINILMWVLFGPNNGSLYLALVGVYLALILMPLAFICGLLSTLKDVNVVTMTLSLFSGLILGALILLFAGDLTPQVYGIPFIETISEWFLFLHVLWVIPAEDIDGKH